MSTDAMVCDLSKSPALCLFFSPTHNRCGTSANFETILKSLEQEVFYEVINHALLYGSQMVKSWFGGCWENITCLTALCWQDDVMGLLFRVWARPSRPFSSEGQSLCFNTLRHFGQCMTPTLWQLYEKNTFLFQHDYARVHRTRTIKT